jgi:uncharacterized tellurite resistance protein B-like protein
MKFNRRQMAAILNVGRAMISADGRIDENENVVMALELFSFGVPKEDLEGLYAASDILEPSDAVAIISQFDLEQKTYVASFLGALMAADGDIDDREMVLWRIISDVCGLPRMTISEAISNIKG